MDTINIIYGFISFFIVLPIWIIAIVLIILAIVGLFKKDFTRFKKILKIWSYFWLAFLILTILFAISTFLFSATNH